MKLTNFFKHNKLAFGGILFSLLVIIIGYIANSGGIIIGGLITFSLALSELFRRLIRELRYSNWIKKNSGKYVVNLYSENDEITVLDDIKTVLGNHYLIVSRDYINVKVLYELASRNNFDLDDSVVISVSKENIKVRNIQNEFDSFNTGNIDTTQFAELIKNHSH